MTMTGSEGEINLIAALPLVIKWGGDILVTTAPLYGRCGRAKGGGRDGERVSSDGSIGGGGTLDLRSPTKRKGDAQM